MAVRFTAKIAGFEQFDRVFTKVRDSIVNWQPIFEEMAKAFYEQQELQFEKEGAFGDLSGWKPLTEKYYSWKQKKFPGTKTLELTGKLRESLTKQGAEGNITEINPLSMRIGTNLKTKNGYTLGTLHQLGTKKMVARPPLRFSSFLKREWTQIIRKNLTISNL